MNKSCVFFTCIPCLLVLYSVLCLIASLLMKNGPDVCLTGIFLLWCAGMIYSAADIRRRILLFFFFITFFVFLLGRPLIGLCRGENWFDYAGWYYYSGADTGIALIVLYLSLLFVWLGAMAGNRYRRGRHAGGRGEGRERDRGYAHTYRHAMRLVAGVMFGISVTCTIAIGLEKIAFMANHTYANYYVSFRSLYGIQPVFLSGRYAGKEKRVLDAVLLCPVSSAVADCGTEVSDRVQSDPCCDLLCSA